MTPATVQPPRRHHAQPFAADVAPTGRRERRVFALSGALLTVAFITGGSSQQYGWGVMLAELLALLLLLCVWLPRAWRDRLGAARWGIAVMCLILAIPLLQLLPIPAWLWQWSAPRAALQHDLGHAGVSHIVQRWSLAPAATKRDFLLLLPAAALFCAALVLPREMWRRLLWWFIALVAFSVLLAFAQLGVPQDSLLNPFPQYAPSLAGVFANNNHQACAMAMGLVLALTLLFDTRAREHRGGASHAQVLLCAILVALFAAILPLVGSRAGIIIGIVGAAAALLACGVWSPHYLQAHRGSRWLFGIAIVVLAVGVYGAFAWMQHNVAINTLRPQMAANTARLAAASMPLGGGAGSFVRMFEQFTHGSLMSVDQGYINAAHNDYLQWWYAGGALAIIAALAAVAVLVVAAVRVLRLPAGSGLRFMGTAALLAILMPALQSTVDYPLRTPALMTCFGLLAGIAVAAGSQAKARLGNGASPYRQAPART